MYDAKQHRFSQNRALIPRESDACPPNLSAAIEANHYLETDMVIHGDCVLMTWRSCADFTCEVADVNSGIAIDFKP